ncbi:DNA integrity scanning diadenylate cyclase DisA [Bacillus mesophilum]|uniref:DNA integrity scanning protein DisA n=1 Tax=Bacillus mesophilum TaxID=1071718 RepID=A0A7V7UT58_9BACI|nr:DNA integrity scanning diadenylate cyclase DisA [Bacillus mesophilum]KAB2329679.1 DNA integrity scanning protein DisA [Bacillus mesophilum]
MEAKKTDEKKITKVLRFMAPGTPIREGIENVLRANTGGLIVLGSKEQTDGIVEGGFQIDCPFTPSYLYELAKMDGAIILNEEGSRILVANAQLAPDRGIPSTETGMRHRTAERVAKQTGALVIAVSQRRNVITLYQSSLRYALRDIGVILTKANVAVQTLEKYKAVLEQRITDLSMLEFEEGVTYADLVNVLHSVSMVFRIKNELLTFLCELGTEGRLIRLQMDELLTEIEKEAEFIIKDYAFSPSMNAKEVLDSLQRISNGERAEDSVILKLLGYQGYIHLEEMKQPRGYRMLNKVARMPSIIIANLIEQFQELSNIMGATIEELDDVDGIGEVRAKKIKEGLKRIKTQVFLDRHV